MARSKDGMDGLRHTDIYGVAKDIMELCACSPDNKPVLDLLGELLRQFAVAWTQNDRLEAAHRAADFAQEMESRANYALAVGRAFRRPNETVVGNS